jgi:cell division septum initiation protein DivIVA
MAEKNFLSWVGFKGEEPTKNATDNSQPLERIRQLEAQLADLRSRRDITALSKEEFEILATETAMSIIKTAQQRESKANSNAERILNESKKSAAAALENAQSKANSLLTAAESRGRKYIEAAESDAAEILEDAERESSELIASRKREASGIVGGAKREADRLVATAATEIVGYKSWLNQVISEAERLYRIQSQSLDAAEGAIRQSRDRLESAFNRLSDFQRQIDEVAGSDGRLSSKAKVSGADESGAAKKAPAKSKSTKAAPRRRS